MNMQMNQPTSLPTTKGKIYAALLQIQTRLDGMEDRMTAIENLLLESLGRNTELTAEKRKRAFKTRVALTDKQIALAKGMVQHLKMQHVQVARYLGMKPSSVGTVIHSHHARHKAIESASIREVTEFLTQWEPEGDDNYVE